MGTVVFYDEKIEWGSTSSHHFYAGFWHNLDKYHKYYFSHTTSSIDFQRGPQPKDFTEVRWWIQDNLEGEVLVVYEDKTPSGGGITVYMYFQHEEDMVAFKLRWL